MAFLNLGQVQEARAALLDEVEAIAALAKEEKRELSADETKRCDELLAKHEAMAADEERCRKLETAKAQAAAKRQQEIGNGPKPETDAAPKAEKKTLPAIPHAGNLRAFRGPNAHQDAYDCGMLLRAYLAADGEAFQHVTDRGLIRADGQTADDFARGGLFVPTVLSNAVIRIVEEVGIARQLADVVQMDSETLDVSRRSSGLTVYSPAEQTAITSSEAQWNRVSLTVEDRATLTRISRKLLRSSVVNLADRVAEEIGYAFALQQDKEFILGDGTGTYFKEVGLAGAIGAAGINTDTTTSGDTWDEITLSDFHNTMAKLPSQYWRMPSWICSVAFYQSVMVRLMAAAGGNTVSNIEMGAGSRPQFLGYPVYFTDRMPTATAVSTIHAYFGSFRDAVMIGERVGVEIASSDHRYFDSDEIAIRGKIAYDINVYEGGDASNAGAYVAYKTGAAS